MQRFTAQCPIIVYNASFVLDNLRNRKWYSNVRVNGAKSKVVKLPAIYVGGKLPVTYRYVTGKLPVTYRPLPTRMGHRALVLKGVGQSLGLITVMIIRWTFLKFEVCDFGA